MITKFNLFEKLEEWNKETGYYVILTWGGTFDKDVKLRNFLENHIGKITKMYYPGSWFTAEFDNTPDDIQKLLKDRDFNSTQILHISKNKEDLEAILQAKKYNL